MNIFHHFLLLPPSSSLASMFNEVEDIKHVKCRLCLWVGVEVVCLCVNVRVCQCYHISVWVVDDGYVWASPWRQQPPWHLKSHTVAGCPLHPFTPVWLLDLWFTCRPFRRWGNMKDWYACLWVMSLLSWEMLLRLWRVKGCIEGKLLCSVNALHTTWHHLWTINKFVSDSCETFHALEISSGQKNNKGAFMSYN